MVCSSVQLVWCPAVLPLVNSVSSGAGTHVLPLGGGVTRAGTLGLWLAAGVTGRVPPPGVTTPDHTRLPVTRVDNLGHRVSVSLSPPQLALPFDWVTACCLSKVPV